MSVCTGTTLVLYTLLSFSFITLAQATVYIASNSSFPANITTACASALTVDIDCPAGVDRLRQGLYYPDTFLETLCTSDCAGALGVYESSVSASCDGETFDSLTDTGYVPLNTIPQFLRYLVNYTCLADASSGQFCNVLSGESAGILADQSNLNSADNGSVTSCSDCDLKQYQFLAGSAFYHDDDTVSAYSSLTASCSATGYPLTTSTFAFNATASATTTTAAASPTCTGATYTIQPGDTCQSISKAQSVGTFWMLLDNGLSAYCGDFPSNGTVCIQHTCTTYTVLANDTCATIQSTYGINYAQMLAWNPQFGMLCGNVALSVGLEICISSPGGNYIAPATTSAATITSVTTAAPLPTNAAAGTTTSCGLWYEAVPGDYCNLIIIRWGISLSDFLILNPEVYSNCTNLYAYESYCVEPVGDISNYPGAPGYISSVAYTTTPASLLPTATYIPALYVGPNLTYANGTRTDCSRYLDGTNYQQDLSNTTFASTCDLALSVFGIQFVDLTLWNPSLAGQSLADCSFVDGLSYCAVWSSITVTTSVTTYPTALPTGVGTVSNCTQYTYVGDGLTCDDVLQDWDITLEWFVSLNPELGTDCSGLQNFTYYCVNTTSTVTTVSIPVVSTTSVVTPPGPTQTGIPSNCNLYYVAQANDDCGTVEAAYGITDADFHAWNPSVSSDCLTNFWVDEAYCVGVSSSGSSSATTTTTAPVTSTSSVTPPGPTQAGIPANCDAYYLVQANDNCGTVEAAFGISDDDFHAWNPAVSSDCLTNFWLGEAYCVGVSGGSVTSTGTAVSATSTSATVTSSVTVPGPTQAGIPANCDAYYVVQSGDDCGTLETKFGITDAEFHAWNPAVSSDCLTNFWAAEAYCVGVSS